MQDVHILFKGKNLLNFEGYTDELSKTLQDNNFESISGIQAVRITKTFIIEIYESTIKEIINTLILEAFFDEKEEQKDFSNIFFTANELKDYILGFEESLSTSNKNSFIFLENLLRSYNLNNATSQTRILNLIDLLNQKLKYANEKSAETLFKLATVIYKVIQDYKSEKPSYIINIKNIKGNIIKSLLIN